jgi:hypothetical protein
MEWAKKHIALIIAIVLIVVLVLPLGINALYLISTDCEVLHKPSEWTTFWGGYLGAIISAAVAFIILYIQRKDNEQQVKDTQAENETQNKANRKLQLNILRYQQEQIRLNNFIAVSSKLITSINPLSLKALCKQIQENNVPQIEKAILDSIDYICRVQREFCLHLSDKDERQKQLGKKANNIIDRFTDVQCDIQNLLIIISVSDVPMTNQLLKEYATDNDEMSKRLKKAILDYTPSKYDGVKLEWEWESIAIALVDLVQNESDKLYDLIDDFVDEERKRIQDILTEGI